MNGYTAEVSKKETSKFPHTEWHLGRMFSRLVMTPMLLLRGRSSQLTDCFKIAAIQSGNPTYDQEDRNALDVRFGYSLGCRQQTASSAISPRRKARTLMNRWTTLLCAATLAASLFFMVAVAMAVPDCDGTYVVLGECGTATPCASSEPQLTEPVCVGDAILKAQGPFDCFIPTYGCGSTLCGNETVDPPIVCTYKQACENKEVDVEGVTHYYCGMASAASVNSTTATKKANIQCNDTTENCAN